LNIRKRFWLRFLEKNRAGMKDDLGDFTPLHGAISPKSPTTFTMTARSKFLKAGQRYAEPVH
jgi:hypothetical protein